MNNSTDIEAYLSENGELTYSNKGTSMLPLLKQGRDLFTVKKTDGCGLKKGDVVLFRNKSGQLVLHRIVKELPGGFVMLGDNSVTPETDIKSGDILGVMTSFVRKGKTRTVTDIPYRIYTFAVTHNIPLLIALRKARNKLKRIPRKKADKNEKKETNLFSSETDKNIADFIYLVSCAVNETTPDAGRVSGADLTAVYRIAVRQSLAAAVAAALGRAGVSDERFALAKAKAVRKTALFDSERTAILSRFEKNGIWYMPLKGIIIKGYYPRFGMREMSDNDILFDESKADAVREIMTELGYSVKVFDAGAHDVYQKEPCLSFEMHRGLFGARHAKESVFYYRDVKARLIKDEGKKYGFHFSDEDFYIYYIAHTSKHADFAGTGVRALLDIYLMLRHFGDKLDRKYIGAELAKLNLEGFEIEIRALALKMFSDEGESAEAGEINPYIASGVYGTFQQKIDKRIARYGSGIKGKALYVLHRVFIPLDLVKISFPFFYRHRILLPLLPVYRVIAAAKRKSGRASAEIKAIIRHNDNKE